MNFRTLSATLSTMGRKGAAKTAPSKVSAEGKGAAKAAPSKANAEVGRGTKNAAGGPCASPSEAASRDTREAASLGAAEAAFLRSISTQLPPRATAEGGAVGARRGGGGSRGGGGDDAKSAARLREAVAEALATVRGRARFRLLVLASAPAARNCAALHGRTRAEAVIIASARAATELCDTLHGRTRAEAVTIASARAARCGASTAASCTTRSRRPRSLRSTPSGRSCST